MEALATVLGRTVQALDRVMVNNQDSSNGVFALLCTGIPARHFRDLCCGNVYNSSAISSFSFRSSVDVSFLSGPHDHLYETRHCFFKSKYSLGGRRPLLIAETRYVTIEPHRRIERRGMQYTGRRNLLPEGSHAVQPENSSIFSCTQTPCRPSQGLLGKIPRIIAQMQRAQ